MKTGETGSGPKSATTLDTEAAWHALEVSEVRERLQAPEGGLSEGEAEARLAQFGPNELDASRQEHWVMTLLKQFVSPMILFLLAASIVTAFLQEWFEAATILLALALNATIGFWQSRKAERDVRSLQRLTSPEAKVRRDGTPIQIDARMLVPGDTVTLASGDKVPADLRLTDVAGLQVDESMFTGEVMPVTKSSSPVEEAAGIGDRTSKCFSGTLVVSGRATGVVVATGTRTELGAIAELVQNTSTKTPLQILTYRLERYIGAAVLAAAAVIFIASLAMGVPVSETFRTSVALIVAAMPEALPIVLSVAMGVGVSRMARHNAVVRNLPSVETLGSATVIGSDKTGTLTVNRMTVEKLWTPDNTSISTVDQPTNDPAHELTFAQRCSLRAGALTNDAVMNSGGELFGDSVDVAMAAAGLSAQVVSREEREADPLANMPYEPELAFSQRLLRENGRLMLQVKGAPETILGFCSSMVMSDGSTAALDTDLIHEATADMARDGLRVIATAHVELDEVPDELPQPRDLVFSGLQGMLDPPRKGVRDAIEACRDAGIHVIMITGDHPTTAEAIGRRLGLESEASPLSGSELAELDDAQLLHRLRSISIAARMSPQDKLRIVNVLQEDGRIVAVTGDGVNDAPALKAASIGVAMGKSGTDVARDSADVVLTDDNFVTIVEAVEQGRVTFASIRKATFFLLSNGLAAMIAVGVNTFADLPLIFLPVMLIFMNVITNGLQDVALAFEKGEGDELQQSPRPTTEGVLNRTMWLRTLITGMWMGIGTVVVYRVAHSLEYELDHARTLALITMVMFNFFQAFSARAERKSLFSLNPLGNPLLIAAAFGALALQWGAMTWPVSAELIGIAPLSATEWLVCTAIGSSVLLIVEAEKFVRRRFVKSGA